VAPIASVALGTWFVAFAVVLVRSWSRIGRLAPLETGLLQEAWFRRPIPDSGFIPDRSGWRALVSPWSVLDQISGYRAVVPRSVSIAVSRTGLEQYATWIVPAMAAVWALAAAVICTVVAAATGRRAAGVVAAMVLVLSPVANPTILGQANASGHLVLVPAVVAIVLGTVPERWWSRALVLAGLAIAALSSAMGVLLVAVAVARLAVERRRPDRVESLVLAVLGSAAAMQVYTYLVQRSAGRRIDEWSLGSLVREVSYLGYALAPRPVQGAMYDPSPIRDWLVIGGTVAVVVAALVVLRSGSDRSGAWRQPALLAVSGVAFMSVSTALNGNLNIHYVLMPSVAIWVAVVLLASQWLGAPRPWRAPALAVIAAAFLVPAFQSVDTGGGRGMFLVNEDPRIADLLDTARASCSGMEPSTMVEVLDYLKTECGELPLGRSADTP
jgi:hypothetical protein